MSTDDVPLEIDSRNVMRGFGKACRKYLAEVTRDGARKPPNPSYVRRVLKDEQPSRKMLENIFRRCPRLLLHPLASPCVRELYGIWKSTGGIPDEYGRGTPPRRAAQCVSEKENGR